MRTGGLFVIPERLPRMGKLRYFPSFLNYVRLNRLK